jgi:hypothetical protein
MTYYTSFTRIITNLHHVFVDEIRTRRGYSPDRVPLPPPQYERTSSSNAATSFRSNSFQQSTHTYVSNDSEMNSEPNSEPSSSGLYDNKVLKFRIFLSNLRHHYHVANDNFCHFR